MKSTVKTIFNEWSRALQIENLKGDLINVANDLNKIKASIVPQTAKTLVQAEKKYKEILNKISLAQSQWNAEAKKAKGLLKKTSHEVETVLLKYKKIANTQKDDLKKSFGTKGKNASSVKPALKKTASPKKTKSNVKAKATNKAKAVVVAKASAKAKMAAKTKTNVKAKPNANVKKENTFPDITVIS